MFKHCLVLVAFLLCVSFSNAYAETRADAIDINAALKKFTSNFDEVSTAHFHHIYGNYNVITVVDTMHARIGETIDACIENNPDMEQELAERFGAWSKAVSPVLEEAKGNLRNMVIAQDYVSKKKIDDLFDMVDIVRADQDGEKDKTVISTKEACTFLLGSMDDTQAQMLSFLRSTLMSYVR